MHADLPALRTLSFCMSRLTGLSARVAPHAAACMARQTELWPEEVHLHAPLSQVVAQPGRALVRAVVEAAEAVQVLVGALLEGALVLVRLQAVRKLHPRRALHCVVLEQDLLLAVYLE
jgi:hypothetical protein